MSPTVPRWSRAYPSAAGRRPCGPFRRLPLPLPTPPPSCVVVVGSRHCRRGPSLAAREREKKRKSVKYPILNLGTGAIWHRSLDSEISLKIVRRRTGGGGSQRARDPREGHVWGCAAAGTAAAVRAAKVVRVRALRGASERLFECAGPVPRSCARCMLRVPDADATRLDLPRTPSAHLPCATRRQLDTLDQNDWLVGSVMDQNRCSAAFGGPCAADTDGSSATATTGPASP